MKVLVYHQRAAEFRTLLADRLDGVEIVAGFDDATLDRHLGDAEAVLTFRLPLEMLGRAGRLRWIQLTSAGVEQLLPARAGLGKVVVTKATVETKPWVLEALRAGLTSRYEGLRAGATPDGAAAVRDRVGAMPAYIAERVDKGVARALAAYAAFYR